MLVLKEKVKVMLGFYPNTESIWRAFIAFAVFYSFTCSVVAQEIFRGQLLKSAYNTTVINSRPNFNLNYNIPDYKASIYYKDEPINSSVLRISPSENINTLVNYFNEESKLFTQANVQLPDVFVNKPIIKSNDPVDAKVYDYNHWKSTVLRKYYGANISIVANGVAHVKMRKYIGKRAVNINILEINKNVNPNLKIAPAFASQVLTGKKKVSSLVASNSAIAGVNASFFKQTNGVPLGLMMKDGELLSGPIYDRVALGITQDGFKMDKVSLEGKIYLSDGDSIKIDNFNQPRMLSTHTIVYSSKWGWKTPVAPKYGINILIKDNEVKKISANPIVLDKNSIVISGPKSKLLTKLDSGSNVFIKITSSPDRSDVTEAIGGGPYLVKNGNLYVDAHQQKLNSISGLNPRTAIGYTKDNVIVILTADGRQENSSGLSLYELAKIMKRYGCYNAMNLDGGTSTQMVVKNRIVNAPLVEGGGYVSNALVVKEEKL